ncbi:MAG: flagellar protein export ATPase FliI [Candidatus Sericytochromatia bacterium]|nr:flagellar protein export ATPase FliI [Candidatus Sericytochromatia bacterium]
MTELDAPLDEGDGLLARFHQRLSHMDAIRVEGRVAQIVGLVVESDGPAARMGEVCLIAADSNTPSVAAEVVGFRGDRLLLMPLGEMSGIRPGSEVVATGKPLTVAVGPALLGRVLDGLGRPIDGGSPLRGLPRVPVEAPPPNPLLRARIRHPLPLGVRALDGLLTCGRGQRLGIFAGSGVGKSTTLGMIARNTEAQLNVICLVGERGREVRDFLERDLGPEGLARSVVVVATSDQPALQRIKCALVATAIAEHFRDQGQDVMLMMDSVTRFAMAQREVGLAIGEPPATKGYTPSVFALLPRLLERAGTGASGSITGLYTVLVEADDFNEPISDAVRGILDGHVILSRELAAQNHYPAIDILASVSRVMPEITDDRHRKAAGWLREALATYKNAQDLINIGAYQRGSNPQIDVAMELHEALNRYLQQGVDEVVPYPAALAELQAIFEPFFAAEAAQGRMH